MAKIFEDLFMDIQADMICVCLEYASRNVDKIFIYASVEGGITTSSHFYKIKGNVLKPHKINTFLPEQDVSVERQRACVHMLINDVEELIALCKEHDKPMPTEIKMVYDVKKNSLNVDYKYDPVYSNHKTKTSYDVINEWIKEVKNLNQ